MDPVGRPVVCRIFGAVASCARACMHDGACDAACGDTCEGFLNDESRRLPCANALCDAFSLYPELMESACIYSVFDLKTLLIEG